jgi:predicted AlkP superfamily phosphohydrolase/phosphomutase
MLSNSVIAAAVASGYLTALVLQLNPSVAIDPATLIPLALVLFLAYGANLTVLFYALIVLRQILAVEVLSPGWLSVRLLSWLCTIAASGGAGLMWLNLLGFQDVLDPETRSRMFGGATLVTVSGVVFLLLGLAHLGRRGGRLSATVLSATMVLSVGAPLMARGPARQPPLPARPTASVPDTLAVPPERRITMLMFDGASLDVISPAVAAGRLPNIARIFDQGAVMHLATLRPTQAEPVWSAVATGRYPMYNGVRSSLIYRVLGGTPIQLLPDYCYAQALVTLGFLREEAQTASHLSARPIWSILSDRGASVGVMGWPLTEPAQPVNGFMICDAYHRLPEPELGLDSTSSVFPPELVATLLAARQSPANPDPVTLVSAMGAPQPVSDYDARRDRAPLIADRVHLQLLNALPSGLHLLAARFPGIDAVGHRFLRYADPSAFGDVSEEDQQRFGLVLEQYYGFVDTLVGRAMERLLPGDLLLVVSAFGMEPLSPGKRVLEIVAGNPQISGTHERAPDGFVLAFGDPVAAGRPARASVVDLAPTILYFLGLPAGRDMDGFARIDLFTSAFTSDKPVTYIPSYGR